MSMQQNHSVFGSHFKYILVLTLLAWIAYTLPSVRDSLAQANLVDDSYAAVASVCPAGYVCTGQQNPTISTCYVFSNNLIYGAGFGKLAYLSNDVQHLQDFLISQGYSIDASEHKSGSAVFGNSTLKAVVLFQKAQKIKVDGIVGPETRAKITYVCEQTVSIDNVQVFVAGTSVSTTTIRTGQKYDIRWTDTP